MASITENFRKATSLVLGGGASGVPLTTVVQGGQTISNQQIQSALAAEGMDTSSNLGPGAPIYPADGIAGPDAPPRSFDYLTGYNIAARPRSNERISFWTLKGVIDSYDIAQLCITHRIDSVRSADWAIVPEDNAVGDMTGQIDFARRFFSKPDGRLTFKAWLGKYLWDVLAYDAGTLYKRRNNAGGLIQLKVVNGLTIAPLVDDDGDTPSGNAPAFTQYIHGNTWKWLLESDIVYVPFRPQPDSMYGRSPIESVLLAANTDLRLQAYFLQQFTEGNVPYGFGISPENWGPDQIADFQAAWDALLLGDQSARQRIRWVPGGSTFDFGTNTQGFNEMGEMPKWLLTKVAAAYHVTPADLGFTENVNKSSGETQADVQNRVGDLPLKQHLQDIFTAILQEEFGLPLKFEFADGKLEEDRVATAQADAIYMDRAGVSPSEIRAKRFGIIDPPDEIVPRYFMTKAGPVPVSSLLSASAPIDPETAAPEGGTTAPAEQTAIAPIVNPATAPDAAPAPAAVAKALDSAATVDGRATEIRAFSRFVKARRRAGAWRDFEFTAVDAVTAHRLNVSGYADIRKAAGEVVAAGIAVKAANSGRVLMLQRCLDGTPNAGAWEFPGGCLEPGEGPWDAAWREWCEETGLADAVPFAENTGSWMSPNGLYVGYVLTVDTEFDITARTGGANPDDPDGDFFEALAWWDPTQLIGNPAVRAELAVDLSIVFGALMGARLAESAEPDPFESAPLAKAWRDMAPNTPQHDFDLQLTDAYAPQVEALLRDLVDMIGVGAIADQVLAKDDGDIPPEIVRQIIAQQVGTGGTIPADLSKLLATLTQDGWTVGQHAAGIQLAPHVTTVQGLSPATVAINWDDWVPGDPPAAQAIADGGLQALLDQAEITIDGIDDATLDQAGNIIAAGLSKGSSVSQITSDLYGVLGARAERIAHTESTRAVLAATLGTYASNGVGTYDLLLSDGACEECVEVANGNPYPVYDQNDAPPIHPYCRCSAAPNADSINADAIQFTDSEGE